jgi:hypothetical protein
MLFRLTGFAIKVSLLPKKSTLACFQTLLVTALVKAALNYFMTKGGVDL